MKIFNVEKDPSFVSCMVTRIASDTENVTNRHDRYPGVLGEVEDTVDPVLMTIHDPRDLLSVGTLGGGAVETSSKNYCGCRNDVLVKVGLSPLFSLPIFIMIIDYTRLTDKTPSVTQFTKMCTMESITVLGCSVHNNSDRKRSSS